MTKFRSWISSIQTFTYFENGVYSCPKVQFDKVPFDWDNAERQICLNDIHIYAGDIMSILQLGEIGVIEESRSGFSSCQKMSAIESYILLAT